MLYEDVYKRQGLYLKYTFSQGSCLVKNYGFRLCQRFKIIAALNQNAAQGSGSNPAEKTHRH